MPRQQGSLYQAGASGCCSGAAIFFEWSSSRQVSRSGWAAQGMGREQCSEAGRDDGKRGKKCREH